MNPWQAIKREDDLVREAEIRRSVGIALKDQSNTDVARSTWRCDIECLLRLLDAARRQLALVGDDPPEAREFLPNRYTRRPG